MKFCNKCKEWKDLTEFYKTTNGGCKKCVQAYHKEWRLKKYPPKSKNKLLDGLRRCSKCREVKDSSEFYKDTSSKTGYQHKCKICSNVDRKQRAQKYLKPKYVLPNGFKKCSKCHEVLEIDKFNRVHNKPRSRCKDCESKYRVRNPEVDKAYRRNQEVRARENAKRNEQRKINLELRAKEFEYRKAYRQRQDVKDKNKKRNEEYRTNPDNQARARAGTIQWRKDNPERANLQRNVKRVRKLNAKGSHTVEQWQELKSFFICCPKCGKVLPLTRDHIIPLSKNGTDYIDNIQPLCRSCNSSKKDGFPVDYRPKFVRYWALDEMAKTY